LERLIVIDKGQDERQMRIGRQMTGKGEKETEMYAETRE
jgi:hypothetical protein